MGNVGELRDVSVANLVLYEKNAKNHPQDQIDKLKRSIEEFGFLSPCLIDENNNVIAGHGRIEAAKQLGLKTVPCVYVEGLTDEQRRAYIIADNRLTELGGWDFSTLSLELADLGDIDIELTGFDSSFLTAAPDELYPDGVAGSLAAKYVAPPFSVLDARKGYWQKRKKMWANLLPDSRMGRAENLLSFSPLMQEGRLTGTSEFDPVLCEVLYNWFCPRGGGSNRPICRREYPRGCRGYNGAKV